MTIYKAVNKEVLTINQRHPTTSFNISDNKRNIEQMLKESLNAFKLIEPRFNMFQHGFKGVTNGFDIALQQNRMDVEANVEAVCSGLKHKHCIVVFKR